MSQYFVIATAIIIREGKFLITQRSMAEEKFPGRWTVPGGVLEVKDYETITTNAAGLWYNVIERLVEREVLEEVGLHIKNLRYVVSMAYQKSKGPALCLSFMADYAAGEARISSDMLDELQDYRWIGIEEASKYDLIDGIHEELLMAEDILRGKLVQSWQFYEEQVKHIK